MITIIGINSSLRTQQNPATQHDSFSRMLLSTALEHLTSKFTDVRCEMIDLGDYKIAFEPGSYSSNENFSQMQFPQTEDDMPELYKKLEHADGVIFASPTYWGHLSGLLKTFFDRLTSMDEISDEKSKRRLQGKVAGAMATAKFDGSSAVAQEILTIANYFGFIIPPHAFAFHTGRITSSVLDDDSEFEANYFAKKNAKAVAENVYQAIKATREVVWCDFQEFIRPLSEDERVGNFNLQQEIERHRTDSVSAKFNRDRDIT